MTKSLGRVVYTPQCDYIYKQAMCLCECRLDNVPIGYIQKGKCKTTASQYICSSKAVVVRANYWP